jgi:hypothetical protein
MRDRGGFVRRSEKLSRYVVYRKSQGKDDDRPKDIRVGRAPIGMISKLLPSDPIVVRTLECQKSPRRLERDRVPTSTQADHLRPRPGRAHCAALFAVPLLIDRDKSAIWIHEAGGERAISSEGYARAPHLSKDGKRAFYLFVGDRLLWGNTTFCECDRAEIGVEKGSCRSGVPRCASRATQNKN